MSSAIYGGTTVEVNDEGFFEDPGKWTEAMAPEIAKAQGIDVLTSTTGRSSSSCGPST